MATLEQYSKFKFLNIYDSSDDVDELLNNITIYSFVVKNFDIYYKIGYIHLDKLLDLIINHLISSYHTSYVKESINNFSILLKQELLSKLSYDEFKYIIKYHKTLFNYKEIYSKLSEQNVINYYFVRDIIKEYKFSVTIFEYFITNIIKNYKCVNNILNNQDKYFIFNRDDVFVYKIPYNIHTVIDKLFENIDELTPLEIHNIIFIKNETKTYNTLLKIYENKYKYEHTNIKSLYLLFDFHIDNYIKSVIDSNDFNYFLMQLLDNHIEEIVSYFDEPKPLLIKYIKFKFIFGKLNERKEFKFNNIYGLTIDDFDGFSKFNTKLIETLLQ